MNNVGKYRVVMDFRVMDHLTDEVLMHLRRNCEVQPPPHCCDDVIVLEMHLELLAKLKMLISLRKDVDEKNHAYQPIFDHQFTVRGKLMTYSLIRSESN